MISDFKKFCLANVEPFVFIFQTCSCPACRTSALHSQLCAPHAGGPSPASLRSAYTDWLFHLAISRGKQQDLVAKAARRRPASSWARVPIVLTSRADSAHSRIASCAIALLLIKHHFRELT